MFRNLRIGVVLPALNEEAALGHVLRDIPSFVDDVVVADNGSTDGTAAVARAHGARVVAEPRRGYGSACLAGLAALSDVDAIVFLDADYSDRPAEMERLLAPLASGAADLVVGSRVRGRPAPGSLTLPQRLGNALACRMLRAFFGVAYTDLGPFRAVTRRALERLGMDDPDYGWTVQMQARAARLGLRAVEVPVSYHPRIGHSKISGTLRGVVGAGTKIIGTILGEAWRARRPRQEQRLVILARLPEPGRTKTRLIPLLGPRGAAHLAAELLRITLATSGSGDNPRLSRRRLARTRGIDVEVRVTGEGAARGMRRLARGSEILDQGGGDLGERMHRAFAAALTGPCRRVVLVGTDCPLLSPAYVANAFEALKSADLVLGPATDGGYTLIGLRRAHAALFRDMPWSTPDLLQQTLERAEALGLRTSLLPALSDVDHPEDLGTWAAAKGTPPTKRPWLSVVVPTLNEEAQLAATLASVLSERDVEIVVSDGGSTDRTVEIARAFGAEVVVGPPSRGRQLNAGARRARGELLLFLHADTRLPRGYGALARRALSSRGTAAAAFDLAIDARGLGLRLVEMGVRVRSRLFGRPYGDQAMCLSASTFRAAGGFPDRPFMEDYVLLARLRRYGRIRIVGDRVRTSGRSWRTHGVFTTTLAHQSLILAHHLRRATAVRPPSAKTTDRGQVKFRAFRRSMSDAPALAGETP